MRVVNRFPKEAGRCSIPGNFNGQVRRDSEQLDLIEDGPDHCRRFALDDL